ncbi:endonuclease or glycosyl hydrolase [Artemisia annua]|uniref:Endonuclease or glycosyl hydrolase n=1 Tax=Artemisia annua TaxID=35608 RepID=A0A2U1MD06_ARTAN|nr:endonuclease or glycosyl hydrolase [Artemisia annua]
MVITGDSSLSPALCALKNRGYSVILATPTWQDIPMLNNSGSILFAWSHQNEEINDDSMWVKPGDVRGLKRNIETLLTNHRGNIKLDDVANEYHALFGRRLVAREFSRRNIEYAERSVGGCRDPRGSR